MGALGFKKNLVIDIGKFRGVNWLKSHWLAIQGSQKEFHYNDYMATLESQDSHRAARK